MNPIKILWLDDEHRKIEPYVERLRDDGHTIHNLPNTEAFEPIWGTAEWEVIIVDILLPPERDKDPYGRGPYRGLHFLAAHLVQLTQNRCWPFIFTSYAGIKAWNVAAELGLHRVAHFSHSDVGHNPNTFANRFYEEFEKWRREHSTRELSGRAP